MASRSLNVNIDADSRGFSRGINSAQRDLDGLDRSIKHTTDLWQDAQGRWRNATGRFASDAEKASRGITTMTRSTEKAADAASGMSLKIGHFSGSVGEMLPMLARVAPALAAVAVAGTSVASSLAAAAGGAASLGAGLAASLAPMLVVGKQVTSRFEEIKKAYEAVQTAQREGTAESKMQADQALANLSRNERAMVGSLGRLSALQDKVLGGASDRVFGGLSKAIDILAPKLEGLAKPFDRLGGAIGGSIGRIAKLLSDGPWQSALHKFVDSATGLVRPITSTFEHIGNILRDVAVAALPYVQKAVQGVATWFGELDRQATTSKVREIVRDLVKHTESWFNLFKEIGKLAGQVFGATAESGRGLVDMMTDGVKAVNAFVGQMRDGSGPGGRFASALGDIKNVAVVLWPLLRDAGSVSLGLLRTGFDRMRTIIEASTPTFLKVKDAASVAFGWLQQHVPPIFERVKAAGQVAFGWLQANVPPIFEKVKGAVSSVVGWLGSNVPPAFNAVKGAVVAAFGAVKGAVSSAVQFVRGWITKHEDDIRAFGQAWKNIGKGVAIAVGVLVAAVKEAIEHVLVPVMKVALSVVKTVWPSIKKIISGVLDVIGGLIQVFSGVFTGDFGRMWDGVKGIFKGGVKVILGIVTGAAKGLLKAATGLGGVMIDGIIAGLKGLGGLLKDAIVGAIKAAATGIPKLIGAALGGLGKAITAGISAGFGKLNPFGDGLGDGLGMSLPGAGLSGGNGLMGAKQIMAPFASMAGRFGLHTSSGARPGAITSSGNVSWHSSGNAIDEAGTPAGMLGYFRFLKNTFGSRLRELIYTPGGIGIKDGRPYQYTGAVAADHYDHVHVAFTGDGHGRKAGTGDGLGRFDATSYGPPWGGIQGGGVTATGVNLKGNPHVYGVAVDPRVIPLGSKLRINPNPFGYSGPFTAFDTGGAIKGNRIDFYDWRGRTAQNGWGHRNVSVSTYSGSGSSGSRGSGGSSIVTSGGSSKPRTGSSGGPPPTVDNKAIYGVTESTVPTFANTFGTPPVKGRGDFPGAPHKGGATLNPDGTDPRQVARDLAAAGPSEFDYLDLALANAEATTGTDDDRSALTAIRDYRARALNAATATGDPRQIAQARRDLTSAESTLNQLVDNTKALTDALTTVGDELKRQTDFAASVQNTSNYQLTKTIADLVSGHIVGRGVAGRAFTPGTGVEVAYAPSVL